jgi:hypothetical protein
VVWDRSPIMNLHHQLKVGGAEIVLPGTMLLLTDRA